MSFASHQPFETELSKGHYSEVVVHLLAFSTSEMSHQLRQPDQQICLFDLVCFTSMVRDQQFDIRGGNVFISYKSYMNIRRRKQMNK